MDFEVKKCTRRCAATDRELLAGEAFYSVLLSQEGEIVRQDFCLETWTGPPGDAIAHWRSQMPDPQTPRIGWAPTEVMFDYFRRLIEMADQRDTLYVLTLLMIRRRLLRLEETETQGNEEWMVVSSTRDENEYRISVVVPTPPRVNQIQNDLARLLFQAADASEAPNA